MWPCTRRQGPAGRS
uniref:Uncharacterized protein n=1 Tax=Arundo donax TaxID=35708 RepID=A0A0A9C5R4_ARUDO